MTHDQPVPPGVDGVTGRALLETLRCVKPDRDMPEVLCGRTISEHTRWEHDFVFPPTLPSTTPPAPGASAVEAGGAMQRALDYAIPQDGTVPTMHRRGRLAILIAEAMNEGPR